MADEQRDLISDRGSGVLSVGDTQRCYCWGHGDGAHGEGEVGTVGTWNRGVLPWLWDGFGYNRVKGVQSDCGTEDGAQAVGMGHRGAKRAVERARTCLQGKGTGWLWDGIIGWLWDGRHGAAVGGEHGAAVGWRALGGYGFERAEAELKGSLHFWAPGDKAWRWGGRAHRVGQRAMA